LVDNYKGGRFNRPNDVICHSNGCLYFTDPDKRRAYHEREIPGFEGDNNLWDGACVYRLAPDGSLSVLALCEYPNGLALSPDERGSGPDAAGTICQGSTTRSNSIE
jgi:gluconolactonase